MNEGTNWTEFAQDQRNVGRSLSNDAFSVKLQGNSHEPDGAYQVIIRKGDAMTVEERRPRPRPRAYAAASIASLVSMVGLFADPTAMAGDTPNESREVRTPADSEGGEAGVPTLLATLPPASFAKPVIFVFVNEAGVTVLLNEWDRRERVSFAFQKSQPLVRVEALANGSPIDQRSMIDLLRRDIAGEYSPMHIVAKIRQVKFQSNESGESNLAVGRESVGRSVQRELVGASEIPDGLIIGVPYFTNVFDNSGEPYEASVTCALDIDIASQRFLLKPLAGELERIKQHILGEIAEQLRQALAQYPNVHVFAGSCNS